MEIFGTSSFKVSNCIRPSVFALKPMLFWWHALAHIQLWYVRVSQFYWILLFICSLWGGKINCLYFMQYNTYLIWNNEVVFEGKILFWPFQIEWALASMNISIYETISFDLHLPCLLCWHQKYTHAHKNVWSNRRLWTRMLISKNLAANQEFDPNINEQLLLVNNKHKHFQVKRFNMPPVGRHQNLHTGINGK